MATRKERLVIVGGDAAGMSAASQVRRMRSDVEIIALERGAFTSYALCGLPYYVAGYVAEWSQLIARTPEAHRRNGIDVRLRTEVIGLDLARREVIALDHEQQREYREPFDQLVLALSLIHI
jgi:NADPH-dependent 2,4-dienoyl-CoA reductase/sulfur reductase-like enzyme